MSTVLTFEEKVLIMHNLMAGIAPDVIADTHQITKENVTAIDHNFQPIMEVFDYKNKSHNLPMRGGLFPQMENILFAWFCEQIHVSNKKLAEKAKQIVEILNETSKNGAVFCGSNNWANAFKKRFNIPPTARRKPSSTITTESFLVQTDIVVKNEPELSQSFLVQTDIVVKNEPELSQNEEESNQGAVTEQLHSKTDMLKDDLQIESTFSRALCSDGIQKVDAKNEKLNVKSKKRKRLTVIANSSDEFSDSGPSSEKKKYDGSEQVLVPTRNGVKSMSLQDYNEDKVIRIFKPILRFAKIGWDKKDQDCINRLYRKSLKTCKSSKKVQSIITEFFRQKK